MTNSDYVQRHADYFRRHGTYCEILCGALWVENNRIIAPFGPVSLDYTIPAAQARKLLAGSRAAIAVSFTDGFHEVAGADPWYAVICRRFLDLTEYNAKKRSQIRKGLSECVVEKVDAARVAAEGHEAHVASCARYAQFGRVRMKTPRQFAESILVAGDFGDIIDFWAVYHQEKMVGYAQNHLFGKIEALYSGMVFHPEYFPHYPSYALVYTMNAYYLRQQSFQYVNDGFRSVLHQTQFQPFLIEKFGFERACTNLYVCYRPYVKWVLSLSRPMRGLLCRISRKFLALSQLEAARTKTAPVQPAP